MNGKKVKKKLMAPHINLTLDHSEASTLSDLDESADIDLNDTDTPFENSNEFEWEGKACNFTQALCTSFFSAVSVSIAAH